MPYAIITHDGPDSAAIRANQGPAHRQYLDDNKANLIAAGHNSDLVRLLVGHAGGSETINTYTDQATVARASLRGVVGDIPKIIDNAVPMQTRGLSAASASTTTK